MIDFSNLDRYREDSRIEAKRASCGLPESIWETYSAFANTGGGIILLGVVEAPDKTLRSIDLPDPHGLIMDFWSLVNNPAFASANILTDKDVSILEADGDTIVAITVPKAPAADYPLFVHGDALQGTYIRQGESDIRCTPEEVRAMLAQNKSKKV